MKLICIQIPQQLTEIRYKQMLKGFIVNNSLGSLSAAAFDQLFKVSTHFACALSPIREIIRRIAHVSECVSHVQFFGFLSVDARAACMPPPPPTTEWFKCVF
ncbi:hypothetical protein Zmor_001964 [Zophobas morio]|uniref:Uncharacterized protein n=1 Tax=Zophobas morio TaxID=2755281 RepID=A0AA38J097_9CUCU|nr:hypothetical protein Zmor_001964 [Zophobas morio]